MCLVAVTVLVFGLSVSACVCLEPLQVIEEGTRARSYLAQSSSHLP